MRVKDILVAKKGALVTNRPEDTVEAAAVLLTNNNIGALPVRDGNGDLVGVISERDIVRGFARQGGRLLQLKVKDLMTRKVVTCGPEDDVKDAMRLMSDRHIRHLPVITEGKISGIISSRDVMESRLEQAWMEHNVLRDVAIASRAS